MPDQFVVGLNIKPLPQATGQTASQSANKPAPAESSPLRNQAPSDNTGPGGNNDQTPLVFLFTPFATAMPGNGLPANTAPQNSMQDSAPQNAVDPAQGDGQTALEMILQLMAKLLGQDSTNPQGNPASDQAPQNAVSPDTPQGANDNPFALLVPVVQPVLGLVAESGPIPQPDANPQSSPATGAPSTDNSNTAQAAQGNTPIPGAGSSAAPLFKNLQSNPAPLPGKS